MAQLVVETSARHAHLTEADIEALFGKGSGLTFKKALSQPGEFASEQRVTVVGPKGEIKNVIVLGPARRSSQIEISLTDARVLGIAAPVRASGDVAGTPGCRLMGPAGSIELKEGVLAAKRHIHITPEDAAAFGVKDKEIVSVKVASPDRSLIFGDVVVRVSEKFATAMHIDTDEANAAALGADATGEIVR